MELSLGLFFGNQGQIGQPLSEEISLLKCSSRSKQKILGLRSSQLGGRGVLMLPKSQVALFMHSRCVLTWLTLTQHHMKAKTFFELQICSTIKYYIIY